MTPEEYQIKIQELELDLIFWKEIAIEREQQLTELERDHTFLQNRYLSTPIMESKIVCRACDAQNPFYIAKVGKNAIIDRSRAGLVKALRNLGVPIKSYQHDETPPENQPDSDIRGLRIPNELPPDVGRGD